MFSKDSKFELKQDAEARRGAPDKAARGRKAPSKAEVPQQPDRLGQLRLLTALDALLREGSVNGAAASMGLQSPAVSRMLGQLREIYGDPLFVRTGKGLIPTPLAESLRQRVRALVAETENLLTQPAANAGDANAASGGWDQPPLIEAPPLAVSPSFLLEGQPTPADFARKLARIGHNAEPHKRLAKYIATIGTGPGRSRPLTMDEAQDALAIILGGEADPLQIGALLSTMHYRGVTAAEVAGFTTAARRHIGAYQPSDRHADIDWPSYLSPKLRTPPWFLHAVRLVAAAGHRVLLHGHHGQGPEAGKLELAARLSGISVCTSIGAAREALAKTSMAYLPIGAVSGQIQRLLGLYPLLEMRLPTNIVVHLLNPLGARASLLGVARPSQRGLHRDAAQLLSSNDIAILGNTRDFAEFTPFRATTIHRLVDGVPQDIDIPSQKALSSPPAIGFSSREYWQAIWTGAARDPAVEAVITSTAAAALFIAPGSRYASFEAARNHAVTLWRNRPTGMG